MFSVIIVIIILAKEPLLAGMARCRIEFEIVHRHQVYIDLVRGSMRKICIFGAGGFAKEVYWLAKQCGQEVDAFIDIQSGGYCCDGKRIENENYFDPLKHSAVVAVGNPKIRKKIVDQILIRHPDVEFATLISPSANLMADSISIGRGSVICANCIITCDVILGEWSQLNLSTTIGHDTTTGAFFTTAPGVHISGKVHAGEQVYFGTNASTVEGINVCSNVTIGAAACVSKDILDEGTYVGVPARKLEKKNG
jgi:sugar O-acyltransferase (sialic acid O-acetyltransferase NeuD family)